MNDYIWFLIPVGLVLLALVARRALMRNLLSSEAAHQKVAAGAVLVDVRSPAEFQSGHIDGAKNIPVDEIAKRYEELPKDAEIVLYCRSGARSSQARAILTAKGFTQVFNLGPMSAW